MLLKVNDNQSSTAADSYFYLPDNKRESFKTNWKGLAFMLEALILLFFLAFCLAVFTGVIVTSSQTGMTASDLNNAINIAENTMEYDIAYIKDDFNEEKTKDNLVIANNVSADKQSYGTMYNIDITVKDASNQVIYALSNCVFESALESEKQSVSTGNTSSTASAANVSSTDDISTLQPNNVNQQVDNTSTETIISDEIVERGE